MENIKLIQHYQGAPFLRFLGLGPKLKPVRAIDQLQNLLQKNTFWAKERSKKELRTMIANSSAIVTLWQGRRMIGFGRGTSDNTFRAVLWDVVIANDHQNLGLGKVLIKALIKSKNIKEVEKIYLMTTNSKDFYQNCGFIDCEKQTLLIYRN